MTRAILINPYDRTIRETKLADKRTDGGEFSGITAALSVPGHSVDLFTLVEIGKGDTLYLDDEGLLRPGRAMWRLSGYPSPLAGCGLILGSNEEGDSVSTDLSLKAVQEMVSWTGEESTGELEPGREGMVEGPDGKMWPAYIGGGPVTQDEGRALVSDLWRFIDNTAEDDPKREDTFFSLRERVRAFANR